MFAQAYLKPGFAGTKNSWFRLTRTQFYQLSSTEGAIKLDGMNQQSELPASHAIDSRHGYAMLLMVVGSIAISFGGLVQRNIEVATPWPRPRSR